MTSAGVVSAPFFGLQSATSGLSTMLLDAPLLTRMGACGCQEQRPWRVALDRAPLPRPTNLRTLCAQVPPDLA